MKKKPNRKNKNVSALLALGQRAIDYYNDTGECVFCEANDYEEIPHEECSVGKTLGHPSKVSVEKNKLKDIK